MPASIHTGPFPTSLGLRLLGTELLLNGSASSLQPGSVSPCLTGVGITPGPPWHRLESQLLSSASMEVAPGWSPAACSVHSHRDEYLCT